MYNCNFPSCWCSWHQNGKDLNLPNTHSHLRNQGRQNYQSRSISQVGSIKTNIKTKQFQKDKHRIRTDMQLTPLKLLDMNSRKRPKVISFVWEYVLVTPRCMTLEKKVIGWLIEWLVDYSHIWFSFCVLWCFWWLTVHCLVYRFGGHSLLVSCN